MAIDHGMNVEQVRTMGRTFNDAAAQIDDLVRRINSTLSSTAWEGSDRRQFENDWNSTHCPALLRAKGDLDNMGQTALRNASRQVDTSNTL